MRLARLILLLLLSGSGVLCPAQDPLDDQALELETVLDSAQQHFPQIMESLARRRIAAGEVGAAAGAFDLVFGSEGFSRLDGFYDGSVIKGSVTQPLRPLGASVFSEYKVSDGDFPIYEDEYFTNTGGTLAAGLLFSLLRDRDIDARRFAETDSLLALDNADLDVLMVRIGVQQRAIVAYWEWVIAGRQLAVYEELLRIALQRESGLQEQVASGARARIFLTENQQNIVRRRSLVTSARRTFENAANRLAFYYRAETGEPLMPRPGQLPPEDAFKPDQRIASPSMMDSVPEALARRPEILMLDNAITRAENRIALRENELLPKLDLRFEVNTGLGDIAEGGPSRDTTDSIVGFNFSVPLQRRTARARLAQSIAERDAIYQERRQLEDQIEIEIRNIFIQLNYAEQLAALAAQEVELAETMRRAEQQRFEKGASDFFLVNVREETAANARVQELIAILETLIARVNYNAATINLKQLGLDPNPF